VVRRSRQRARMPMPRPIRMWGVGTCLAMCLSMLFILFTILACSIGGDADCGTAVGNPNLDCSRAESTLGDDGNDPSGDEDSELDMGDDDSDCDDTSRLRLSFVDDLDAPVTPDTVVITLAGTVLDDGVVCTDDQCDVDLLAVGDHEGLQTVEIDAFADTNEAHEDVEVDYETLTPGDCEPDIIEHTVIF
jgi:hypothetical protein